MATHPDDEAVDRFAAAMKAKLSKKRSEGRGGWENKDECSADFLSDLLRGHVEKGDPVDVANLAMMLHQRDERISPVPAADAIRAEAEGARAWPEWATDEHIAQGILDKAERVLQMLIHSRYAYIAGEIGGIKMHAGTLLTREQHRAGSSTHPAPSDREGIVEALRELLDVLEPRDIAPPDYTTFLARVNAATARARAALRKIGAGR